MEKYGHFKNQGRLKIKINELQIDENVQQSSTNNSLEPKKKKKTLQIILESDSVVMKLTN